MKHVRYVGESVFPPFESEGQACGWYRDDAGDHFGPLPTNARSTTKIQETGRAWWAKRTAPWAPIDPWRDAEKHFAEVVGSLEKRKS